MSARLAVEAILRAEEDRADAIRIESEPTPAHIREYPDKPYTRCSLAVRRWWKARKPGAPVTSVEVEHLALKIRRLAR